ncbi:MAG: hypothetical protein FIB01_07475 [Gemmatimonadetes bacterium]|nr:hypothetical protein [Gemmatimonadota bacterium]
MLLEEQRPEGGTRHWLYDAGGCVHQFRDSTGSVYTYEHSSWNLRAREFEPAGGLIRYEYTASEQLALVMDAGGNVSEYQWDLADRLAEVRRHGRVRERYERDAAGNLVAKYAGDGRLLASFEIGPGNQKLARHLASGDTHSFGYDEAGRRVRHATLRSETAVARDEFGRVLAEKRDGKGAEYTWRQGRIAEAVIFGRFRIRYLRDGLQRLTVQDPLGGRHQIRQLGPGLVEREHANGVREFSQYDSVGRCVVRQVTRGRRGEAGWVRTYRYSGEGDLLEADDSRRGPRRFTFDASHRLTSEQAPEHGSESYEYDVAGNLIAGPELRRVRVAPGNRLTRANGETFRYDDRDHVAGRDGPNGETEYEYDANDMLVACATPHGRMAFEYDAIGRRVARRWQPTTGPAELVEYYWEGDRLLAEIRDGRRTRIWVFADPLALAPCCFFEYPQPDATPASGTRYYVFADQVGAPVRIENDRGEPVWQAVLRPYGSARVAPESSIDYDLRFPGHLLDPQTGLHYNRFRYYSPELGRYLQSDPTGIVGGLNLYAYTPRPLTRVDVRGLACGDDPKKPKDKDDKSDEELANPRELEPGERDIKGGKNKAFDDMPELKGKTPEEVRAILRERGFEQTKGEKTGQIPGVDADGNPTSRTRTDPTGGSEIWMRKNADGSYEAVRMDEHGHNPPPPRDPNKPEPFAGDPGHAHLEHIPDDQARRDNATYPFDAKDGSFKKGDNVVPPGSSNEDVADKYNQSFTPGVYDPYDDQHNQRKTSDFKENHIPLDTGA